jgi:YebC/PmpR family DNA-binding regulatory protein
MSKGELGGGVAYEEITYEGYGPSGVAVIVEVMTDNKNRTVAEIRHLFSKHGGNLGENGCVAWMFDKKGNIVLEKKKVSEDALMEVALEAGADDVRDQGAEWEVITDPMNFEKVKRAIDQKGWKTLDARVGLIPQNTVKLEGGKAEQMMKLMERLEDNDDVQNVYANFDISDEVMEKLSVS